MRTSKETRPSISSDKVLHLTCPTKWSELSQEQLRYCLTLIGSGLYNEVEIRTLLLIRLCGITVIKKHPEGFWSCSVKLKNGKTHFFDLQTWQVQDMIGQLSFVNSPEDMDVRLEEIHGLKAVNGLLFGLPFIDYLNLETCYQGYLVTKQNSRVEAMAKILYRDKDGNMPDSLDLDMAEITGTLFWFFHVKKQMAKSFPNFFRPVNSVGEHDQLAAINAQLRALTDGDITKETTVKQYDCWRCLTELDAKAREADEFKRKYGNK